MLNVYSNSVRISDFYFSSFAWKSATVTIGEVLHSSDELWRIAGVCEGIGVGISKWTWRFIRPRSDNFEECVLESAPPETMWEVFPYKVWAGNNGCNGTPDTELSTQNYWLNYLPVIVIEQVHRRVYFSERFANWKDRLGRPSTPALSPIACDVLT